MAHAADPPFPVTGLLRFSSQSQFDPVACLRGLADLISPQGQIFEQSRVATNAAKYGAFSNHEGRILLTWRLLREARDRR